MQEDKKEIYPDSSSGREMKSYTGQIGQIEQREYPRVRTKLNVSCYEISGKNNKTVEVYLRNLSSHGMCFYMKGFLSLSHRLAVELTLPGETQPVKAIFQILWMHRAPVGGVFKVGGRFVWMSGETENALNQYIDKKVNVVREEIRKAIKIKNVEIDRFLDRSHDANIVIESQFDNTSDLIDDQD